MADDFTRLQFAWLDQVAADASLPPLAARVAIILLRYYSRTERAAWPSIATLGRDLGADERSIQRALKCMTPRHLAIITGGGRSATNRYRWNISTSDTPAKPRQNGRGFSGPETPAELSPFRPQKPRQNCQGMEAETPANLTLNPGKFDAKTPAELPPEPTEENLLKEPTESISIEKAVCEPRKSAPEKRRPSAPKKGQPKATEADFETWWKQYPRHVAKAAAEKAYERIVASRKATVAELMNGALRYAAERTGQDPQFTKHPSTWLNGACWADEPQAPAQPKAPRPLNRRAAVGGMSAVDGILGLGEDDFA
jgi:hypothetical protein